MSIHLKSSDIVNAQQMEVAVNGPDGATHLILCTGVAELSSVTHETYSFLVGTQLSRRQFVGAIASGALATIQGHEKNTIRENTNMELGANLILIDVNYDDETHHVKVRAEVSSSVATAKLAISYTVNILAELPLY